METVAILLPELPATGSAALQGWSRPPQSSAVDFQGSAGWSPGAVMLCQELCLC